MPLFLGILKELNNIRFKLSSDEPLDPATVLIVTTDAASFSEEVPMTQIDPTHFEGVWNTQSRALGIATAVAQADDLSGNLGVITGEVDLISSYGRRYGQDYGNGL